VACIFRRAGGSTLHVDPLAEPAGQELGHRVDVAPAALGTGRAGDRHATAWGATRDGEVHPMLSNS
jgi:hypothetical protein